MSWKPEVIADSSGKWAGNAMRFATESEAVMWAADLSRRWMPVRDYRAAPSADPVNYRIDGDGVLHSVPPAEAAGSTPDS